MIDLVAVQVSMSFETSGAALADASTARLLKIRVGSALTHLVSIISDDKNEVVEYLSGLARPDMYQIRNTLKPGHGSRPRSRPEKK